MRLTTSNYERVIYKDSNCRIEILDHQMWLTQPTYHLAPIMSFIFNMHKPHLVMGHSGTEWLRLQGREYSNEDY